jgi:hypothetical protein
MTAVGAFEDWKHGQNALHELLHNGFTKEHLGIMARGGEDWVWDVDESRQDRRTTSNPARDPALLGARAEDLWSVGLAAGELPGVGPTIAGGALAPVIQGNAGLRQELTLRGIPDGDAQYYEDQFRKGSTVVIADVTARSKEAASILDRRGAQASLVACTHSHPRQSPNLVI